MKSILVILSLLPMTLMAQTIIKGKVSSKKGEPVELANVFIQDSYDGTSTDENGNFEFETEEEGTQTLVVRSIGYVEFRKEIDCNGTTYELEIMAEQDESDLDPVVISIGAFEASDEKKSVVMRPLDIVTTAGAGGDLFQAIKTLPGAQQVGEQEGLFVRGGSAAETKTIIDEMIVQNPFFSSVPDVPQRGRFSPFLFKGTIFSTGGYSAVYGQALSSALILNSVDMFEQNVTSIGILPIGGNLSHTFSKKNTAVSLSAGYSHLGPYFRIIKQLRDWQHPPEGANASLTIRQKVNEKGIFKFYGTYSQNQLAMSFPNIDNPSTKDHFSLFNRNVYVNSSYKHYIGDKWSLFTGVSYTTDTDDIDQSAFTLESKDELSQVKMIATRDLGKRSQVKFGGEYHDQEINATFNGFLGQLKEQYAAGFAEGDIFISRRLATRVGMRFENSSLINQTNLAPRAALSYKISESSQSSIAYGKFYQTPENQFLFSSTAINFENATHYIVNYQYMQDDRTFRIEFYNKEYDDLVLFDLDTNGLFQNLSNEGNGYAQGFDIFYRDKKSIKNADFWISYSFLDTRRRYRNFPIAAAPSFTSTHTLSTVFKYWISKITTSVGFTYSYGSGRPYYNPNLGRSDFHSESTPDFRNLSINASHLTSILGGFTVIFASVDNVFNRENVFSYRFSADGSTKSSIGPPSLRSFFVGLFVSFDHDKRKKEKEEAAKKVE